MATVIRHSDATMTLASLVLFVVLFMNADGNYIYQTGNNYNAYHHAKSNGHYSHPILHHKHHHQHHGNRLQTAAVGVINRGRLLPLTATTPAPTTMSPLDRLMNKLDTMGKQSHYEALKRAGHESHRRHDPVPSTLLRSSSDRRFAQLRSGLEDSYEDEDEDDDDDEEDEDVLDDGNNEEEDEEEDDEDDIGDDYGRYDGENRQHQNHRSHNGQRTSSSAAKVPWYDSVVADFPDHQPSGSGTEGSGAFNGYSSYSDYKWKTLNKDKVDMIRNHRTNTGGAVSYKSSSASDSEMQKAVKHAIHIAKTTHCKVPSPRIVQVKDFYPHPSKTYIPHCTILHRCSDDTGCCGIDTRTCIAHKTEPVDLFFYSSVVEGMGRPRAKMVVEKLTFDNHTECKCMDRTQEYMAKDRPFNTDLESLSKPGFRGYYRPDAESTKTPSSCRCTSQFSARHVSDGNCVCECFDKQRDCIRLKRGKDMLTHDDRLCILRGDCTSPTCEFGSYLRKQGRCPRKREKFDAWQHYPLQHDEEYK